MNANHYDLYIFRDKSGDILEITKGKTSAEISAYEWATLDREKYRDGITCEQYHTEDGGINFEYFGEADMVELIDAVRNESASISEW